MSVIQASASSQIPHGAQYGAADCGAARRVIGAYAQICSMDLGPRGARAYGLST